jgi:hypothetical protein
MAEASEATGDVAEASEATGDMSLPSVQVALDLIGRSHLSLIGILTGPTKGPALPKQVPTLVELNFHGAQPLMFLGFVDLAVLHLGPELALFGDELVDLGENVTVLVHPTSLPDYGVGRGERQETRDRIPRRTCTR